MIIMHDEDVVSHFPTAGEDVQVRYADFNGTHSPLKSIKEGTPTDAESATSFLRDRLKISLRRDQYLSSTHLRGMTSLPYMYGCDGKN